MNELKLIAVGGVLPDKNAGRHPVLKFFLLLQRYDCVAGITWTFDCGCAGRSGLPIGFYRGSSQAS